ncbi:hypothetical protein ACFYSC_28400 [Streptosporangium sp. NPDC004379]|uniref:hypothetical protein n=1 Tax=Streptosporangium sp. NPDC004379 TaxID=3366189 RepID=UPI00367FD82B
MLDSLVVPLLVTTDLPPEADLAEFGRVVADAVRVLPHGEGSCAGFLRGGVFWLDGPRAAGGEGGGVVSPMEGELRFAALLGHLCAAGAPMSARGVAGAARVVIAEAVAARYGELGSPAAVMAIRSQDVRERTPESAVVVVTSGADARLVAAARSRVV